MSLARFFTTRLHTALEPWQSAARKGRLRDFDLAPGAVLPVARLQPGPGSRCTDPLCGLLAADARGFHSRNAPRSGLRRWGVPSAMLLDLDRFPSGEAYAEAVSRRSRGNIARASA